MANILQTYLDKYGGQAGTTKTTAWMGTQTGSVNQSGNVLANYFSKYGDGTSQVFTGISSPQQQWENMYQQYVNQYDMQQRAAQSLANTYRNTYEGMKRTNKEASRMTFDPMYAGYVTDDVSAANMNTNPNYGKRFSDEDLVEKYRQWQEAEAKANETRSVGDYWKSMYKFHNDADKVVADYDKRIAAMESDPNLKRETSVAGSGNRELEALKAERDAFIQTNTQYKNAAEDYTAILEWAENNPADVASYKRAKEIYDAADAKAKELEGLRDASKGPEVHALGAEGGIRSATTEYDEDISAAIRERDRAKAVMDYAYANRYADLLKSEDVDVTADKGKEAFESFLEEQASNRAAVNARIESNLNDDWASTDRTEEGEEEEYVSPYDFSIYDPNYSSNYADQNENWSDDEKRTFYYLFASNREAAFRYGNEVNQRYASEEESSKQLARHEWLERDAGNAVLASLATIPANILAGADYIRMLEENKVRGGVYESQYGGFHNYSNDVRGYVGSELNRYGTISDSFPFLGGKGWGDAYQLLMSMGDSAVAVAAGGGVANAVFFGSAAASATTDALERGLAPDKALAFGFASGLAEVAGETFSVENLLRKDTLIRKGLAAAIMQQGLTEGSEEMVTTLINTFADALINGDKRELQQKIDSLAASGMSYEDAKKRAWLEWAEELGVDAIGGLLSGSLMSAVHSGMAVADMSNREYSGDAQALFDLAELTDEGSESRALADRYKDEFDAYKAALEAQDSDTGTQAVQDEATQGQERVAQTEEKAAEKPTPKAEPRTGISALKGARLETALAEDLGAKDRTVLEEKATARLTDLGVENAGKAASAVVDRVLGSEKGAIGRAVSGLNFNDSRVRIVLQELTEQLAGQKTSASWLGNTELMTVGQNNAWTRTIENGLKQVRVKGSSERSKVTGATMVDGKLNLTVEQDGKSRTLSQDQLDLSDSQQRALGLLTRVLGDDAANAYDGMTIGNMGDVLQVMRYASAFGTVRDVLGRAGVKDDAALVSPLRKGLTDAQVLRALAAGRKLGPATEGQRAKSRRGTGAVSLEGGTLDGRKLGGVKNREAVTNSQRYKTIKKLAEALGIDVVLYESATTNDKGDLEDAPHGAYKDGVIWLDWNAGVYNVNKFNNKNGVRDYNSEAEALIFLTMSHELTHFLEQNAEKEYNELRDFITQYMADNGKDFNGMVRRKLAEQSNIDHDEAVREVIADACQTMLVDSKYVEQLINEKPTLWERIRDWIRNFFGFAKTQAKGPEFEAIRDVAAQISELWDRALQVAVESRLSEETLQQTPTIKEQAAANILTREQQQAILDEAMSRGVRTDRLADLYRQRDTVRNTPSQQTPLMLPAHVPTAKEKAAVKRRFSKAVEELMDSYLMDGIDLSRADAEKLVTEYAAQHDGYFSMADEARQTGRNKTRKQMAEAERNAQEGGKAQLSGRNQVDRDYLEAVERGDMETAQLLVNKAAVDAGAIPNKSGRGPLHLYHGTPSFGFSVFRPGVIFLTDNRSIAAGYTKNKGYGRVRKMSEYYTSDDGTDATLLKNAKNVLEQTWHLFDEKEAAKLFDEVKKTAVELNDRVNNVYTSEALDVLNDLMRGMDEGEQNDLYNALNYMISLPGTVVENIDDFKRGDYSYWGTVEDAVRSISYDIKSIEAGEEQVKDFLRENRDKLKGTVAWDLYKFLMGYDLGDFSIDVQHKMLNAMQPEGKLISINDSVATKDAIREQIEKLKSVGSYDMYGFAGNNPLVIDGKGAFWTNIEAPMLGEGTFSTDTIAELAPKRGYTSVQIKNIMDSSMNEYATNVHSDVFIFFDSSQVKSADPVTYDDAGNVIPLSERFNSGNPDIRYSARTGDKSDRELLLDASDASLTDAEQKARAAYRAQVDGYRSRQQAVVTLIDAMDKAVRDGDATAATKLRAKLTEAEKKMAQALAGLTEAERGPELREILRREREIQRRRTDSRIRESYGRRELRQKVDRLWKDLTKRLSSPSEKKNIPVNVMMQAVDVLEAINMDATRADSKAGQKLRDRLNELKSRYNALKNDPDFRQAAMYDPQVAEFLDNMIETVGDTPINRMSAQQLAAVYNTLKALDHVARGALKVRLRTMEYSAYDISKRMTEETRSVGKQKAGAIDMFLNASLSPARMFNRLGGYHKDSTWSQVYEMLNEGQLRQTQLQVEGSMLFEDLLAAKDYGKFVDPKNTVNVGLKDADGKTIEITHGMLVSLYMHLMNEQNRRHVVYGGLTIPGLTDYYNGKKIKGTENAKSAAGVLQEIAEINDRIRETDDPALKEALEAERDAAAEKSMSYLEELQKAVEGKLTEYDRKWIAACRELFDGFSKRALNEATMQVYGIKRANVENYFPIWVDGNFLNTPFESVAKDFSLENAGFMKERVDSAKPIRLADVSDVAASQIRKVAQYAGLMPVIHDFNKIWGKTQTGYRDSVRQAVMQTYGQSGVNYIENLMADLNGARGMENSPLGEMLNRLRGHMAQASLTLSLRTAMGQAASYPTAAAVLGWDAIRQGITNYRKVDPELILKWSPLLKYRMQGFRDPELGQIAQMNSKFDRAWKKARWATGWIQAVDGFTVGQLVWSASEAYVQIHDKSLKKGTDAYYEAVAKKFNEAVELTQPNYTTMQRPDILRNPNALVRQLTMFLTQRLQNFNIMYDAAATYSQMRKDRATGKYGVTNEDVRQAGIRTRTAVLSQITAAATIVAFKFLADMILHSMNAYRDDDDELTKESISAELLDMFLDSLAGNVLGGGELYDLIESKAFGKTYYGIEVSGVSTVTDALKAVNDFYDKVAKGEVSWKDADKLAKKISVIAGIPYANAEKIIRGGIWHVQDMINGEFGSFEAGVDRTTGQQAHRLWRAYDAKDFAQAKKIREEVGDDDKLNQALAAYIKKQYADGKINKFEAQRQLEKYAGKDKETAEKTMREYSSEVETGIKFSQIEDSFLLGDITAQKAQQILVKYGGLDAQTAKMKVDFWGYQNKNPGSKLEFSSYKTYVSKYQGIGLTVAQYESYSERLKDCKGVDADGDGKTDSGSKKAEVLKLIDSMSLTPAQKDQLYFANNYGASGLKDTPWHK